MRNLFIYVVMIITFTVKVNCKGKAMDNRQLKLLEFRQEIISALSHRLTIEELRKYSVHELGYYSECPSKDIRLDLVLYVLRKADYNIQKTLLQGDKISDVKSFSLGITPPKKPKIDLSIIDYPTIDLVYDEHNMRWKIESIRHECVNESGEMGNWSNP